MKREARAARQADECLELVPQVMGALKKMLGSPAVVLDLKGERTSMAQLKILWVVSRYPEWPMTRMARELCLRTPTVTHHVNLLVAKGMLRRAASPGDRRLVSLALTPKGARYIGGMMSRYRDYLAGILDHLSTEALHRLPGVLKTLVELLEPVTKTLDRSALQDALVDRPRAGFRK